MNEYGLVGLRDINDSKKVNAERKKWVCDYFDSESATGNSIMDMMSDYEAKFPGYVLNYKQAKGIVKKSNYKYFVGGNSFTPKPPSKKPAKLKDIRTGARQILA
jgi:hypothetical protein